MRGIITDMETLTKPQKKDIRLIGKFVEIYCAGNHLIVGKNPFLLPENLGKLRLCIQCAEFMDYAVARRLRCPLEREKPTCKHCRIHCYAEPQLAKVKEIMAYSGRKLMMRGRLDYVWRYFY